MSLCVLTSNILDRHVLSFKSTTFYLKREKHFEKAGIEPGSSYSANDPSITQDYGFLNTDIGLISGLSVQPKEAPPLAVVPVASEFAVFVS